MTSILLTQKLLTMKLDKTEFDRIRREQADVNQEKRKMVNVLKVILDQQLGNKTCRLCLKPGGREIFDGGQEFDVVLNIRYILGIEIAENDGKPQHICEPCEVIVRQASKLKQTAEATQWRLQQEQEMVASSPDWSGDGTDNHDNHDNHDNQDNHDNHVDYFKLRDADVAREWLCRKCQKVFHSQGEFREHRKQPCRRVETGCICEICGLQLKTMILLKRHSETHTEARAHACPACPYRGRTAAALGEHARRHAGRRTRRCARCPAAFASQSSLASHRRTHLPPRHACEHCGRPFTFRAALKNHIASQHSDAKPFKCDICEKTFSTRKMFRRHEMKVHNRPKMRFRVPVLETGD